MDEQTPIFVAYFHVAGANSSAPMAYVQTYTYTHTTPKNYVVASKHSRLLIPIDPSNWRAAFFEEKDAWYWLRNRAIDEADTLRNQLVAMETLRTAAWSRYRGAGGAVE